MSEEQAVGEFVAMMQDPAARQAFAELRAQHAQDGTRRSYAHVLNLVGSVPWAIREEVWHVIKDVLAFHVAGGHFTAEEIQARIGPQRPVTAGPQGVAVLPLHGVLIPKASMMSEMSGGTSIQAFRAQFRDALQARDISSIVMDVDSPGGMVDQVPEMAAEIRAARGTKPIVAVANGEMASAAYWLASQADEIVATRSGRVGSIGVLSAHEDESAKAEHEGVKTTIVSAGKYKAEGNPFEPLSGDALAHRQKLVDEYYGMFVGDVAKGRKVPVENVRGGFAEGRVVGAADAVSLGMADRIGTLEDAVVGLLKATQSRTAALAAQTPLMTTYGLSHGDDVTYTAEMPDPTPMPKPEPVPDPAPEFGALDDSAWDGNRAMGQCSTAAEYRSICAGEHTVGTPDQRQHWALPHHYLGQEANAAGVAQARGRLAQTQELANRDAARNHLFNVHKLPSDTTALAEEMDQRALLDTLKTK